MEWIYNITQQNRELLLKFMNKFSLDQLNQVPEGYKNSIYWNIIKNIVGKDQKGPKDRGDRFFKSIP